MDVRAPFFQNMACVLIGVIFLNPLMSATAQVVVDASAGANATLGQAGNGVPIVNIAAPNDSGLSHNRFTDYNVGQQGLILNNSTERNQSTQLGGFIVGNGALNGRAAGIILNEVTGPRPSQLQGYTEVAGKSANVIVANPHGITCNGCGFINTPRATLTTGKPIIENGNLTRYQVDGGKVVVEGAGIDASNLDSFELIARSATINAQINANKLAVIAGANDVDAQTLAATPRAANPADAPQLAIDSSALGGMYAGAIRLVGTEKGVGVKLAGNMAASAGDIQIDASGKLSLAQASSQANLIASAQSVELTANAYAGGRIDIRSEQALNNQKSLAAREQVSLAAAQINNAGVIEAGVEPDLNRNTRGDVTITAQDVRNSGSVVASRGLQISASGQLNNQGGEVLADSHLQVDSATLNNTQKGLLQSQGTLSVNVAGKLDNSQTGSVASQGKQTINAGSLDNSTDGLLTSKSELRVNTGALDNRTGALRADGNMAVTATTLDNTRGVVTAKSDVQLNVDTLQNADAGSVLTDRVLKLTAKTVNNTTKGQIAAKGNLEVDVGSLIQQDAELLSQGSMQLKADRLENLQGSLIAANQGIEASTRLFDNRGGELSSKGAVLLSASEQLDNQGGKLLTDAQLKLASSQLDNSRSGVISGKGAVVVETAALDNSLKGDITSNAGITLKAGAVDNSQQGRIAAKGAIDANLTSLNQQAEGTLNSETSIILDLNKGALINSDRGLIATPGALLLRQIGSVDNSQGGELSSQKAFTLETSELNNQGGRVLSAESLLLRIAKGLDNSLKGVLSAGADLTVTADSLNNSDGGTLVSRGNIGLDLDGALNNQNQGNIVAGAGLQASSGTLQNNNQGLLSAKAGLEIQTGTLNNSANGQVISQTGMSITSADLNNRSGVLSSKQGLNITAADLDNSALIQGQPAGLITSEGNLSIAAKQLNSSNGGEISSKGDLELLVKQFIQSQGRLISEKGLRLNVQGGDLDNSGGLISVRGPLNIENLNQLNNSLKGEISSQQGFSLLAKKVDNSQQGRIISSERLQLAADELNNSNQGLLSGWQGLSVKGGSLNNSASGTLSSKEGALDVELTGALDNSNQGALVSRGQQKIAAASLNNAKGIISGESDVALSVTGKLDNTQGGLISAKKTLLLDQKTTQIDNQSGEINAQSINLQGQSLDNSAGQLTSLAGMTLGLSGSLINTNGARLASAGDLLLVADKVENSGAQLISQSLLSITANGLNNSQKGTLASQGNLLLRLANGALQNQQNGLIYSKAGTVDAQAGSLNNQGGTLQSQGDNLLRLSGALNNQGGRLDSLTGKLDIQSTQLNNSNSGVLNSTQGQLKLVTGQLNNNAGTVQAQSLDIRATGGVLNQKGHISALQGNNQITTTDFDNQGGGLYASDLLSVTGQQFFNQGAALGQGGKIGAGRVDFGLAGVLNNQFGQLESESELLLRASQINNVAGSLRALGTTGTTRLIAAGGLNNGYGVLETANQNLDLQIGSLSNGGGRITHTGSGTFGLGSAQVMQAGGVLSSNGLLNIRAASWTNSSVLQAGKLVLDIGDFTQTESGQLLARESITGTGNNWTNNGLLASDGTINLSLSGAYSGTGQLTSLGNLTLNANSMDIAQTARITGAGLTTIGTRGLLRNIGKLTSSGDMVVTAGELNNVGTLGAAQQLTINTPSLRNLYGLIFSGGNMALNVDRFSNFYADVYSLGDLRISRDNQLNPSSVVENISATLESSGDLSIRAQALTNRSENFSIGRKLISGYIAARCNDCKGDNYNIDYVSVEVYQGEITGSTPTAYIVSGRDLYFRGDSFYNLISGVSAARDIGVEAREFSNKGVSVGVVERRRTYNARDNFGEVKSFVELYLNPYNQRNDPSFPNIHYIDDGGEIRLAKPDVKGEGRWSEREYSLIYKDVETNNTVKVPQYKKYEGRIEPVYDERSEYDPNNLLRLPDEFNKYTLVSDIEVPNSGGEIRSAVVQAGRNVTINATQSLENSVINENSGYQRGANRVGNTGPVGTGKPFVVTLNRQLPPDLAQKQINPLTLPGFTLPQGENGLFRLSGQGATQGSSRAALDAVDRAVQNGTSVTAGTNYALQYPGTASGSAWQTQQQGGRQQAASQAGGNVLASAQNFLSTARPAHSSKYLIETNPELTNLKQFLSSDYLLGGLGNNPDVAQKRLGDGLYEQRLIREAIVSRTGQRFLAGATSDEETFRYLMNNAITSKEQLNLSVGVSLSAEQVAALTHDIVWLEEQEVNGEKVLVPMVYLAQAEGRLAPNGALIQGRDLNLISGGELKNSGTLRAANNLNAVGNTISNSGLIEADNRLSLLATDSIRNSQGGVIAGRDVNLTALTGDIINERTVSRYETSTGNRRNVQDFADSAARIEAAERLTLVAGQDVGNVGSVLSSGRDMRITAGRDVAITSAETSNLQTIGSYSRDDRIRQYGAELESGRDIVIGAGRDIAAVASKITATRDINFDAGRNTLLTSAANEDHFYAKSKKVTQQTDSVEQQSTEITAGGSVNIRTDENLILQASNIKTGEDAYLVAGESLALLSAEDSEYSLYEKKKKGSWGSKSSRRDEVTKVTNVGSEITTGGNLSLVSGGDQLYQAAKLDSGEDINITSGGAVTFEGVKDLTQESHEKSNNSAFWMSSKGKGQTDETLQQTQMLAAGNIVIKAVDGLNIDVKQVNQQTVSQSIDAMVQADPSLSWLKQAEARGDVNWQQVKEIHDSFKYSNSGLGPASQLIIAIVMAAVVGPMALAAGGTATAAVATSLATNTAVSTVNNRGKLGAVFKDVTSSNAMKGYAVAGVTAGLTSGYFNGWTGSETNPVTGQVTTSSPLNSLQGAGQFASKQLLQNGTSMLLNKALGQGGSASDALKAALFNTLAAVSFTTVGDYTEGVVENGSPGKIAIHAMVGGLLAEATGGDFKTGALAAGANEALVASLDKLVSGNKDLLSMSSQIVGVLAAASQKDADAAKMEKGAWIAENATQYNYTAHWDEFEKQYDACKQNRSGSGCSTVLKMAGVSNERLGNVALSKDNSGAIVSYTLLDEFGKPWMVMEPAEYKMYVALPPQIQEGYKTAPQWQLNLSSVLLYANGGDAEKAAENYAFMLRDPGYQQEMLLALAMGGIGGRLASGAKGTGGAAGKVDDLATSGLSSASNLPSGTGLGGFKVGLSAGDITAINSQFGGSVSFREVDTAIANAANYDGFYNKAGSMIRDIAGGHLFDNGNKRTAVEVVEQLIIKNGVDGPPKQIIWNVVDKVATGKLTNVQDISKALRGLD